MESRLVLVVNRSQENIFLHRNFSDLVPLFYSRLIVLGLLIGYHSSNHVLDDPSKMIESWQENYIST